jgi:hypothetical protein
MLVVGLKLSRLRVQKVFFSFVLFLDYAYAAGAVNEYRSGGLIKGFALL